MSLLKTIAIKKRTGTSIKIRAKTGKTFSKKVTFSKAVKILQKIHHTTINFSMYKQKKPF
jgi:hypothetical protein